MEGVFAHLAPAVGLIAILLFIFSIIRLSKHETAFWGNKLGMIGMGLAMVAALPSPHFAGWTVLLYAVVAAALFFGVRKARTVEMTALPMLVALLNSFGGLAAALIAFNDWNNPNVLPHGESLELLPVYFNIHNVNVSINLIIGMFTFVGSVIA